MGLVWEWKVCRFRCSFVLQYLAYLNTSKNSTFWIHQLQDPQHSPCYDCRFNIVALETIWVSQHKLWKNRWTSNCFHVKNFQPGIDWRVMTCNIYVCVARFSRHLTSCEPVPKNNKITFVCVCVCKYIHIHTSWWFQPIWNIWSSNWIIPQVAVEIKTIWVATTLYHILGTQMTPIFEGQPPKTRPFPIKIRGHLGSRYTYIYIYIYIFI